MIMNTYPKSESFLTDDLRTMMMGPNPVKLLEELMEDVRLPAGSRVCDLGSGRGLTSLFLAKEYGLQVTAADLWSEPADNQAFFERMGAGDRISAVRADATALPFEPESFDAVISVDSYHYFGRDPEFLDRCVMPFVRPGGLVAFAVPGLAAGCHETIPEPLLKSCTPEQLDYIQGIEYWRDILSASRTGEVGTLRIMRSNEEVWADWLKLDNEYAVGDRKAIGAGALKWMYFVAAVVRKLPAQGDAAD